LGHQAVDLAFSIGGGELAAVDEVLELLLVLVGMAVRLVAKYPPLLDEVLECAARVACGPKAKLARGFGRGQGPPPTQQVEQLRGEEGDAGVADGERGQAQAERRQQRRL